MNVAPSLTTVVIPPRIVLGFPGKGPHQQIHERLVLEANIARDHQYPHTNIDQKDSKGNRVENIKEGIVPRIAPEILNLGAKQQQQDAEAHQEPPDGTRHDDQDKVLAFVTVPQEFRHTAATTIGNGSLPRRHGAWLLLLLLSWCCNTGTVATIVVGSSLSHRRAVALDASRWRRWGATESVIRVFMDAVGHDEAINESIDV